MPDDPIQPVQQDEPVQENTDDQNQTPEPKQDEIKPAEENPQPEGTTPEIPTPTETPVETPPPVEEQPQPKQPEEETPKVEEPKPEEKPEHPKATESPEPPKEEVKKQAEGPEFVQRINERLKEKLLENKKKADVARIQRRKNNLNKIIELAMKKEINNQDVRDLLQVSQSTATEYVTELSKSGRLKSEKKARATIYKT